MMHSLAGDRKSSRSPIFTAAEKPLIAHYGMGRRDT